MTDPAQPATFADRVRVIIADHIAHVELIREDKLNALDPAMFGAIVAAGQYLFDHGKARCVVLSGAGRAFCAGLDLMAMADPAALGDDPLTARTHGNANLVQQAAMVWRKLPMPVIAALHGVCLGGGLQIAAGADVRVAAPDTRLSIMEMKWGIVPDMGGFALWRGCVRDDVLRELVYTNREFSGEEAAALGVVTLTDADPLARAKALAKDIAARNPDAVRAAKRLFSAMVDQPTDAILAAESRAQHALIGSANQREAVMAAMGERAPVFTDHE